jgi:CheY-like chemotaxis protein
LERLGYQVLQAASGLEALRTWEEHQDTIDLLVTDVVMPSQISGTELAVKFRERRPNLRVVFISGYSQESSPLIAGMQQGVRFLQKPFTPHMLAAAVRDSFDGP